MHLSLRVLVYHDIYFRKACAYAENKLIAGRRLRYISDHAFQLFQLGQLKKLEKTANNH